MQLSVRFENTRDTGSNSGPVTVGWCLNETKAGIIYAPPERVRSVDLDRSHAKSASRCPAVINLESRHFLIRCPFDIHIGFARDDKGKPVLQLSLPYLFLSDEPVYMSQVAPFMHYSREPLPGTIFGGRFPINVWPRPLMWAFEWHEPQKPLKIARGDPLFYACFETLPQDRGVAMVEAQRTPELLEYLELISGAVNYVNQTFSLFEAAEARRPETLVTPVARRPRQG